MIDKYRLIRCFAYTLEIIVLFLIQQTPDLPTWMGARPFLLIPALFSIAMLENERVALGFGVFTGLLLDVSCGYVLGFHAIVLCVMGYFTALLATDLIKTNLLTVMLVTALGVAVTGCLQFVFFYCLHSYGHNAYAFQYHYLPMMLVTYLPTPLLYYFNKAFAVVIRERE